MEKSAILASLFLVFFFGTADVSAEKKIVLEGNTLVVSEVREAKRIPNVPAGLSPEDAYNLVIGELKEKTIRDKTGKAEYSFSFPLKKKTTFLDRMVVYNGKWGEEKISRTEESQDWKLTVFWLVIPAVGILIVSFSNRLTKTDNLKLLVFYGAVLVVILAGGLAGVLAGVFAGMLAGMFAGGLAGVLAGGLAGGLAGEQGWKIVLPYLVFVGATMLVSYIIAKFPAIKSRILEK